MAKTRKEPSKRVNEAVRTSTRVVPYSWLTPGPYPLANGTVAPNGPSLPAIKGKASIGFAR